MPPSAPAHRLDSRQPRILLAPDSFKGTFTAEQVARALAKGARRAGVQPDLCPLADGGEGTLAVLQTQLGGQLIATPVHDPLNRVICASYLRIDAITAVVESALASGLGLITDQPGLAVQACTYGTGELIAAAAHAGARHILVTVGGSATTDGGAGALAAIDACGGLRGAHLEVLCDVTVAFEQAAAVFGPQKGASPAQVTHLTERLRHIALQLDKDPRGIARTGCAGGLSGALWANHDAALVSGAEFVMDAVQFDKRALAAELIITGEGAVDEQTLQGKLVRAVTARAQGLGRPCAVIAGQVNLPDAPRRLSAITARPARSLNEIATAAREICRKVLP